MVWKEREGVRLMVVMVLGGVDCFTIYERQDSKPLYFYIMQHDWHQLSNSPFIFVFLQETRKREENLKLVHLQFNWSWHFIVFPSHFGNAPGSSGPWLVPHWWNLSPIRTSDSSSKDVVIVPRQRFCLREDVLSGAEMSNVQCDAQTRSLAVSVSRLISPLVDAAVTDSRTTEERKGILCRLDIFYTLPPLSCARAQVQMRLMVLYAWHIMASIRRPSAV